MRASIVVLSLMVMGLSSFDCLSAFPRDAHHSGAGRGISWTSAVVYILGQVCGTSAKGSRERRSKQVGGHSPKCKILQFLFYMFSLFVTADAAGGESSTFMDALSSGRVADGVVFLLKLAVTWSSRRGGGKPEGV